MKKKVVVNVSFFLTTLNRGRMEPNMRKHIGFLCLVVAVVTWSMPDVTATLLLLATMFGNCIEFETLESSTTAARAAKTNADELKSTPNPRTKPATADAPPPQATTSTPATHKQKDNVDAGVLPCSGAQLIAETEQKCAEWMQNSMRQMHPSTRAFAAILDDAYRQLPPNTDNGFLVPAQSKDAS